MLITNGAFPGSVCGVGKAIKNQLILPQKIPITHKLAKWIPYPQG